MDLALPQRYDRPVPRYTSYPTAPHFHSGVADEYPDWLARLPHDEPVSLYFHVPFCTRMCWYCGCHTKVVRGYRPVSAYAALLEREISLVADAIPAAPRIAHVHWGGGTPTILSSEDFAALMDALRARFAFAAAAEIAVEIDPRGLSRAQANALAAAGVTRANLGVQDFTEEVQRAINRIQPFETTARAVEWLRGAGIAAIGFDLMYGLPRQGLAEVIRTVDLAARLAPDRLAVFGYAHVPWMKTHQRMIDESVLPDGAERLEQLEGAAARLAEHGYLRIGLDHFARPDDPMARAQAEGRLRRNFQGYTDDRADTLLGFGASAIGALPQGYVQNAVPLRAYGEAVRDGRPPVAKGLRLDAEDRLRRAVIERLMCDLEVDLEAMSAHFARPEEDFATERDALAAMQRDSLVELDGNRLRITETGRPFVRSVCALFDQYLGSGTARHSRAV